MRMYRSFIQLSTPFWTWPQASVVFTDLVRKIVCKSIAGLASWTIVSLYRSAHSGGPSPSRHKQGISLPSGEFSVWPHRRNWSIYVSFSFLSTSFCFSFSFSFTFTFCSWPWAWLFYLFLSFIHFLSHWQVAGLKYKRRYEMKLGLGVWKLSRTHSGDGCWFASAKVSEMFATWSHAVLFLLLSLTEFPFTFFCPHLSDIFFYLFIF